MGSTLSRKIRSEARRVHRLAVAASAIALCGAAGCATSSLPPTSAPTAQDPAIAAGRPAGNANYRAVTVLDNLERPWGLAWLPDGTILIAERAERVRVARDGRLSAGPIPGLPQIFAQDQGGLLDVVAHPRFSENQLIYFSYSHGSLENNRTRIARAKFDGSALRGWEVIFEVFQTKPRGQHFGSRLVWLPDGTLLASIGDGGNPPIDLAGQLIRQQAQNVGSHLGKVICINDDGSVPADNPFVGDAEAQPEVWSYGHRNIQGLAFDAANNRVWATEPGSRGGDEVNLVVKGENYGWPLVTHSREYSGGLISPETSLPGMVDPKLFWTPAIAPSGLAFYSGDKFPEWQGNLFAGGLVSRDIRRLELDAAGEVVNEESIPIGERVREVVQGPDGLLYVLTDEDNGKLIRFEPN